MSLCMESLFSVPTTILQYDLYDKEIEGARRTLYSLKIWFLGIFILKLEDRCCIVIVYVNFRAKVVGKHS